MEKLRLKLKKPSGRALFHDSRADSAVFMDVFNALHDKVNEMIDENTKLEERIKILETEKKCIESVKMSFKDAPDGARFRYPNMSGVWVKINSHPKGRFCDGNGLIVQWNGNKRGFQSYASFCDKESGIDFNTEVELV